MTDYRLYLLGRDGHVAHRADLEAIDDSEAIELARLRLEAVDVEIWCGARKVALVRHGMPPVLAEPR